ncbi:MAG: NADH-quinone oxidoreductase subunit N [Bacteroidota bacterium]
MDFTSLHSSLNYIIPEIAVAIFLMVIVGVDLIFSKDKRYIPYIAIIGLLVTGYLLFGQLGITGSAFALSESQSTGMVAVDPYGIYFKLLIVLSSLIVVFISMSSQEIKNVFERQGEYYALMYGMILGMMLMVSAVDLILIYLSIELLSLSSYVLAGFTKLRDRNSEAALKYIIYGSAASGMMLFGISLLYGLTGNTNIFEINAILQSTDISLFTLSLSLILIFVGLGFKLSAVPFHFWTPDIYEGAPIAITAYLSVASKAAAFGILIRFVSTTFVNSIDVDGYWQMLSLFDWQTLLILISLFTMTLGNLTALWQNNLKRLLAYSSIAHAGYILLGLAVLSHQGVVAVMLYFFAYLLMNLGAFYVVMLISDKTGKEDIHDLNGLGFSSPMLAVPLSIFFVALAGIPPTFGFIAKLNLFAAVIDANLITVVVIALLNTVVSVYYYARIFKHLYFSKEDNPEIIKVSSLQSTLVIILTALVILLGIYFQPVIEFVTKSAVFLTF